ncbi:ParB/RepB/Spo0J family partition protein [Streptomyces sp. NPDC005574]|uniref:ParB/RepB/Spo0J family partition protein n=1 Tax=Streptomyces sp. NPDC005574 TaxID=3156891 RepID=UPI0033B93876
MGQRKNDATALIHLLRGAGVALGDFGGSGREPTHEIREVPIALLALGESPRLDGHDADHVLRLAETEEPLPPVLVDRRGLRVIDGFHRVMAAMLNGQETIEVEYFDGSEADAFLRAVEANVRHGLPLTRADRQAAVERILSSHPYMADRAIAQAVGLGARTVARIRQRSQDAETTERVGLDGRMRPLDHGANRREVVRLLHERPRASLREIARAAGVSPTTVADVRRHLDEDPDPVPQAAAVPKKALMVQSDSVEVLQKLIRDPSLRHKEDGRRLLCFLQHAARVEQERTVLIAAVPPHCADLVQQLALQYATTWSGFAEQLADGRASVD